MQKNLVRLFSRVRLPEAQPGAKVDPQWVSAFNTEVASIGFTLSGTVIAALGNLTTDAFIAIQSELREDFGAVAGADKTYRVLFNKFPYSTPEQHSYLLRRIVGFLDSQSGEPTNHRVLACGHVIDPDLFNLGDFGACPICQHMSEDLPSPDNIRHTYQNITPLRVIDLADTVFIRAAGEMLLARKSSLSPDEKAFVLQAASTTPLTAPKSAFRETLPLIYQICGAEATQPLLSGATDVLRIAAYLADETADLSLTSNVKFKVKTSDKKKLLGMLDQMGNLAEDMMRHREAWLRLGERLNPASADNKRRFPNAAAAFDKIRNSPKSVETFNRAVEAKTRAANVDAELLSTLQKRPGEFARRLDSVLRRTSDAKAVEEAFGQVADKVPTKTLLELAKFFGHRGTASGSDRVFFLKGEKTKVKVIPDKRARLPKNDIQSVIDTALQDRFASLPPMGKVYVDADLTGMLIPFNRRGDSSTSAAITKGSRYPINPLTDVVRLFIWWKGNVDVDLSLVLMDNDFKTVDQVSYTNLRSRKIVHSGDVQDAPNGGSEFVDFEIADLLRQGIRYASSSAISFRGEHFSTFPCFAGFMERDALKSGARYEPESVAVKFDVQHDATYVMPLIFDLFTREVVFADVVGKSGRGQRVDGSTTVGLLTKAVLDAPMRKPTFHDLISVHARARGEIVETREEADVIFDRASLDQEAVMAEMMA